MIRHPKLTGCVQFDTEQEIGHQLIDGFVLQLFPQSSLIVYLDFLQFKKRRKNKQRRTLLYLCVTGRGRPKNAGNKTFLRTKVSLTATHFAKQLNNNVFKYYIGVRHQFSFFLFYKQQQSEVNQVRGRNPLNVREKNNALKNMQFNSLISRSIYLSLRASCIYQKREGSVQAEGATPNGHGLK